MVKDSDGDVFGYGVDSCFFDHNVNGASGAANGYSNSCGYGSGYGHSDIYRSSDIYGYSDVDNDGHSADTGRGRCYGYGLCYGRGGGLRDSYVDPDKEETEDGDQLR